MKCCLRDFSTGLVEPLSMTSPTLWTIWCDSLSKYLTRSLATTYTVRGAGVPAWLTDASETNTRNEMLMTQ